MIHTCLNFVAKELNAYFKATFRINDDRAIVSNLVNHDGTVPTSISDKMVISLVNIEQETINSNLPFTRKSGTGYEVKNPPVSINLYVLFSGNFNDYNESLKFVSATILFFQTNMVFLSEKYPEMGPGISKLVFELFKTDYQSMSYLWSTIGAKYMPSMSYKVRMLTFDEGVVKDKGSLLTKPEESVKIADTDEL